MHILEMGMLHTLFADSLCQATKDDDVTRTSVFVLVLRHPVVENNAGLERLNPHWGEIMKRIRRVVVPGLPHHVVLHGVRSVDIFTSDSDRRSYILLLDECAKRYGMSFWMWCLMTNHVHLVVVPADELSLAKGLGEAHRRYSRRFNALQGTTGHLFRARFFSYPVQLDANLLCVARYIEINPVMAGMVASPGAYAWSSARYHLHGERDPLVRQSPLLAMAANWKDFLADGVSFHRDREAIERHLSTGRPLGSPDWIAGLEAKLGRPLAAQKVGRKRKPPK